SRKPRIPRLDVGCLRRAFSNRPLQNHSLATAMLIRRTFRGAELRIAETRAVNRALRKAYGIGLCSVEELVWRTHSPAPANTSQPTASSRAQSVSNNGQLRLKDKLSLLIRQHNLDPTLVKAYAADFCGTESLRAASRELVESFIAHIEK